MAKDKISQYSTTNALNTDIGGIDIDENCLPSNLNNGIREVMSQLKEFQDGTSGDSLTITGNATLNGTTIPASKTLVDTDSAQTLTNKTLTSPVVNTPNLTGGTINNATIGASTPSTVASTNLSYTGTLTGGTGVINIGSGQVFKDASGNVGIGTSSPTARLKLNGSINNSLTTFGADDAATLRINNSNGTAFGQTSKILLSNGNNLNLAGIAGVYTNFNGATDIGGALAFGTQTNAAGGIVERLRIDSSGNVGIGTSAPDNRVSIGASSADQGLELKAGATRVARFGIVNPTVDNTTYIGTVANNNFLFRTNNVERMRIDSSGNVGIGTSSPARKLSVVGGGELAEFVGTGDFQGMTLQASSDTGAAERISFIDTKNNLGVIDAHLFFAHQTDGGSRIQFATTPPGARNTERRTERARIDSSGNLLVGVTSIGGNGGISISPNATSGATQIFFNRANTTAASFPFDFRNAGTTVGFIQYNNTATTYSTSSDYRLKEDAQPVLNPIDRLMQLKPINFAWKVDGSRTDGFLAHEAQAVVPQAVTGTKDAVDKDGKPVHQGIDQSKLVPLLTAALQDAIKRIEQLELQINSGV